MPLLKLSKLGFVLFFVDIYKDSELSACGSAVYALFKHRHKKHAVLLKRVFCNLHEVTAVNPRPPEAFSVTRPAKGACCNTSSSKIFCIFYNEHPIPLYLLSKETYGVTMMS